MAENAIDRVREAEAKAEETTRAAQQQAAHIVDDANTQAVKMQNDAEDTARDKAANAVAAAHKQSQVALEEGMQGLAGQMDALRQTARGHQPGAVQMILEALV